MCLLREVKSPFSCEGKCWIVLESLQGIGPHITLRRESRGVSRVVAGSFVPLGLRQGPQGPVCIASGNSSLHASCEGRLGIPLQSVPGPRSSSGAEATTSGFLSSDDMDLGVPLEFPQGSQASSHVETWKSTHLSSWKSNVRLPVE